MVVRGEGIAHDSGSRPHQKDQEDDNRSSPGQKDGVLLGNQGQDQSRASVVAVSSSVT